MVRFRVNECTEYRPFNQPSVRDMHDIAWIVQPKKKGPAGFDPTQAANKEGEPVVESPSTDIEIVPPKPRKRDDYDDD